MDFVTIMVIAALCAGGWLFTRAVAHAWYLTACEMHLRKTYQLPADVAHRCVCHARQLFLVAYASRVPAGEAVDAIMDYSINTCVDRHFPGERIER